MTVNLSKNSAALMVAYKEVVDAKSDTNWALFTYEGNSNDVRLAEKGEGGLEEMVEELSSGKIMYAFCRVHDPSSGLPKYVLINWTGEGVQNSRKGICANHVCSIAKFLKGAHVTINARTEEDVDPESILTKVAKASGVNFNFHTTQENTCAPRRLLVSGYQKTNAIKGIQRTEKDDFWAQAQREEEFHQNEENKTAEQEREKMKRKRREMDKRQEQEREKVAKAPGANLNFHTTQENTHAPRGPVGSVYQKTNAIEEIQRTEKDHFWAQAQREEEVRRKEVIKTAEQQREKMEQERREMDKRQEQEGEKVAKANFNLHTTKENTRAPRGPVGSGYQKTNAIKGIQRIVKDHFWAQAQREEEVRRKEVKKTREEEQEREKMDRERREMDKRQEHEREKGSYQKKQEMEERQKEKQQRENQTMDSNNRQKTGTHIAASVQKANEAKLLISQRPFNPRDVFKQQVQSGPPLATSKPGKLQSPFLSPKSSERVTQMGPRCRLPVAPLIPGASSSSLSFGSASPVDHSEGAPSTITSDLIVAAPSPEAPASPVQSTEEYWSDEFDDDDDDDEEEEDAEVATPAESTDQEDIYEEPPPYGNEEEELYDDIYQAMPVEEHGLETSGHGICARALYDYQAVDDTELSLDPNDIITGIEMTDEGWWKGYGPGGYYGLFPGNYVELL